jgi:hypothetical protein
MESDAGSATGSASLLTIGMIRVKGTGEGLAVPLRFPKRHEKLLKPERISCERCLLSLLLRVIVRRRIADMQVILL